MSDASLYRRKAEEMLRLAAAATDLNERGRFVDQAVRWHMKAAEMESAPPPPADGRGSEDGT